MLADGVPENVGASSEYYVFQCNVKYLTLCKVLGLELKHHYFKSREMSPNDMGADFRYLDRAGKIGGSEAGETVYLEVKSQTQEGGAALPDVGQQGGTAQSAVTWVPTVYIVVIVTAVTHAPRIAQLIIDPIRQVNDGAATVEISGSSIHRT